MVGAGPEQQDELLTHHLAPTRISGVHFLFEFVKCLEVAKLDRHQNGLAS